jgi:hypothetical protein
VLATSKDGTDDSWIRRTHGLSTASGTADDFWGFSALPKENGEEQQKKR